MAEKKQEIVVASRAIEKHEPEVEASGSFKIPELENEWDSIFRFLGREGKMEGINGELFKLVGEKANAVDQAFEDVRTLWYDTFEAAQEGKKEKEEMRAFFEQVKKDLEAWNKKVEQFAGEALQDLLQITNQKIFAMEDKTAAGDAYKVWEDIKKRIDGGYWLDPLEFKDIVDNFHWLYSEIASINNGEPGDGGTGAGVAEGVPEPEPQEVALPRAVGAGEVLAEESASPAPPEPPLTLEEQPAAPESVPARTVEKTENEPGVSAPQGEPSAPTAAPVEKKDRGERRGKKSREHAQARERKFTGPEIEQAEKTIEEATAKGYPVDQEAFKKNDLRSKLFAAAFWRAALDSGKNWEAIRQQSKLQKSRKDQLSVDVGAYSDLREKAAGYFEADWKKIMERELGDFPFPGRLPELHVFADRVGKFLTTLSVHKVVRDSLANYLKKVLARSVREDTSKLTEEDRRAKVLDFNRSLRDLLEELILQGIDLSRFKQRLQEHMRRRKEWDEGEAYKEKEPREAPQALSAAPGGEQPSVQLAPPAQEQGVVAGTAGLEQLAKEREAFEAERKRMMAELDAQRKQIEEEKKKAAEERKTAEEARRAAEEARVAAEQERVTLQAQADLLATAKQEQDKEVAVPAVSEELPKKRDIKLLQAEQAEVRVMLPDEAERWVLEEVPKHFPEVKAREAWAGAQTPAEQVFLGAYWKARIEIVVHQGFAIRDEADERAVHAEAESRANRAKKYFEVWQEEQSKAQGPAEPAPVETAPAPAPAEPASVAEAPVEESPEQESAPSVPPPPPPEDALQTEEDREAEKVIFETDSFQGMVDLARRGMERTYPFVASNLEVRNFARSFWHNCRAVEKANPAKFAELIKQPPDDTRALMAAEAKRIEKQAAGGLSAAQIEKDAVATEWETRCMFWNEHLAAVEEAMKNVSAVSNEARASYFQLGKHIARMEDMRRVKTPGPSQMKTLAVLEKWSREEFQKLGQTLGEQVFQASSARAAAELPRLIAAVEQVEVDAARRAKLGKYEPLVIELLGVDLGERLEHLQDNVNFLVDKKFDAFTRTRALNAFADQMRKIIQKLTATS